jgi:predicted acetyltransferase
MTAKVAEVRYSAEGATCQVSVVAGDQTVAQLAILQRTMHLAGATVTMGGIADVVTHPAHRRQGYGARLLEGAVTYMREERYQISLLFGITDFYHRFGYAPVLPEYAVTVATRDAERLASPVAAPVRAAGPDDAGALLALYTQVNARRTGTLERTAEAFDPRPRPDAERWWSHPRRFLVAEVRGRPAAYAILHGDPARLRVLELGVPAEHVTTAGASLVAAVAQEAVTRRLENVRFPLPLDEPLVDLLRQVGCRVEVTYPANGEGMGRIVNLPALAEALAPVLAPLAASLPDTTRPGELELVCPDWPEGRATVRFGRGRTIRLALPQPQLCQLVMGYRDVDAIRLQQPRCGRPRGPARSARPLPRRLPPHVEHRPLLAEDGLGFGC